MFSQRLPIKLTKEERRIKREARRKKQREANLGRAAKMHAARLIWKNDSKTSAIHPPAWKQAEFHVGCSGWFYWHWRGDFYPPDLPTKQWFSFYAKNFKTVELNAPFYSWPTVATVNAWVRQATKRSFVYTVKASELITHIKRFSNTKTLIQDFGHIADLLGPRMGCFLFQLPPSFHFSPARLQRIISQLDLSRRNVVEFRHSSWWNNRVFDAFRSSGIIFCSCSGPRLPDQLVTTTDNVYVRFHGVSQWYRHDYSAAELAIWVNRFRESGAKRIWAYFNNDRNGFALKNARLFLKMLKARRDVRK